MFFLTRSLVPVLCMGIAVASVWGAWGAWVGGLALWAGGAWLWIAAIIDRESTIKALDRAIVVREETIEVQKQIAAQAEQHEAILGQLGAGRN